MKHIRIQLDNRDDGKRPYPVLVNAENARVLQGIAWAEQLIGFTRPGKEEITLSFADAMQSEPELAIGLQPVFTAEGGFHTASLDIVGIEIVDLDEEQVTGLAAINASQRKAFGYDRD